MDSTLVTSLPYIDLLLTGTAVGLWMAWPQVGPWPLLLAMIPWILRRWVTGRWGLQNPFLAPLALFLLSAGIGVWAAYDREMALAKFWLIVGAILLFLTLSRWLTNDIFQKDQKSVSHFIWIASLLGALASLFFIVTNDWDSTPTKYAWLESVGKALQTPIPSSIKSLDVESIHRNVIAGILAVLAPFAGGAVGIGIVKRERVTLAGGTVALVVVLAGLILSGARGAWLALGAAAMLAAWWQIAKRLAVITHVRWTKWFLGGPILVVGIGIFILVIRPSLATQFLSNWSLPDSGLARGDLYANSLTLVRDYPLTGGGLGGFMMLYSTYALLVYVGFSTHSHNLFLDLVIEQGVLAVVAFGWMWILMGRATWQSLIRDRRNRISTDSANSEVHSTRGTIPFSGHKATRRILLGSAGLSLLVMTVHGLIDDPLYSSRGLVLMFVPLAIAAPMIQQMGTVESDPRRLIAPIGFVIVLFIGLFFWRPVVSTSLSNLAAVRQSKAELSVYKWPDYPIQDAVRRELDLEPVISAYERSLELSPANSSAHRRLGQIELSLGRYESALNHLQLAYKAHPEERVIRRLLAEALAVNGRVEEGVTMSNSIDNDLGQLDARRYWYGYIDDAIRQSAIDMLIEHRAGA